MNQKALELDSLAFDGDCRRRTLLLGNLALVSGSRRVKLFVVGTGNPIFG